MFVYIHFFLYKHTSSVSNIVLILYNQILYLGTGSNNPKRRSLPKRSPSHGTPAVPKSLQLYRTPRMPTENEAMEVFKSILKNI
jgi:hypothetical protein